ncbi:MAG: hypothetical protein M1308_19715 [Actinobacteria bacterium]|nr:hypothetical protein [Actinomycetota bacterium]
MKALKEMLFGCPPNDEARNNGNEQALALPDQHRYEDLSLDLRKRIAEKCGFHTNSKPGVEMVYGVSAEDLATLAKLSSFFGKPEIQKGHFPFIVGTPRKGETVDDVFIMKEQRKNPKIEGQSSVGTIVILIPETPEKYNEDQHEKIGGFLNSLGNDLRSAIAFSADIVITEQEAREINFEAMQRLAGTIRTKLF